MSSVPLGYPGRWYNSHLYDDGGLPVHLYPFPVTADGQGPADTNDRDHDICWCLFEGCIGIEDQFGFPKL
jgi:hypothetical protein